MADLSGGGRTNQTTSIVPSPSNCTITPPADCNGHGTVQNCDCVCDQGYATDYTNLLDPQWCVLLSTDGRNGTSPPSGPGSGGSGGSSGGGTGKTSMLNRTSGIVLSLLVLFLLLGLCWGCARWRKGKSFCCCCGSSKSSSKKHRHKRKRHKSDSRRSSTSSSSSSQYTSHHGGSRRSSTSSSRNDLLDSHSKRKKRKDKHKGDVPPRPYKKGRSSSSRYAVGDVPGTSWPGAMPASMSYGGWMPSSMGGMGWPSGPHHMQAPMATPFRSGNGQVRALQQQQQQQPPGTIRMSRGGSVDGWALPHRSSDGWGGQDVRIDINFPPEAGQQ